MASIRVVFGKAVSASEAVAGLTRLGVVCGSPSKRHDSPPPTHTQTVPGVLIRGRQNFSMAVGAEGGAGASCLWMVMPPRSRPRARQASGSRKREILLNGLVCAGVPGGKEALRGESNLPSRGRTGGLLSLS